MKRISISSGIDRDITRFSILARKILAVAENDADEMFRNPIAEMLTCAKDLDNPTNVSRIKEILDDIIDTDILPIDMVKTARSLIISLGIKSESNHHTKITKRRAIAEHLGKKRQHIKHRVDVR